jgi:hypothetical protein
LRPDALLTDHVGTNTTTCTTIGSGGGTNQSLDFHFLDPRPKARRTTPLEMTAERK